MNKKKIIYPTLLFLVIAGVAIGVRLWPRTVPDAQCGELYEKYAEVEGIRATFIKDYRVNDSVFVDVTVLEATTDSAWIVLKDNYNIPKMTPEVKKAMSKGSPCIAFCRLPDQNTAKEDSPYTDEYALVVAVHNEQTIYVFYLKTKEQKNYLVDMFFEKYFLNI